MLEELRKKKATKSFQSFAEILLHRVLETPDLEAFSFPDKTETWKSVTWKQVHDTVRAISGGLRKLGLGLEDRVAILSLTRIEWIYADMGITAAGGACTTIYPSNTPEECEFILVDSGTRLVFAENDGQVAKLQKIRASIPEVFRVVTFDGKASDDGWVITWDDFLALGKAEDAAQPAGFVERISQIQRHHLATLIYTSGTTGRPKGVELVQDCWVFIAEAFTEVDIFRPDDKQFLWLPMSHSFGKVLEVILVACNVPTAVDGRVDKIIPNLAVVRPTWMAAAPRIFEKVYNKVVTDVEAAGGLKERIFKWAISVGREVSAVRQAYKEPSGVLALKLKIADKLVFSKIRDRFGGRVRFFVSGSAPLSRDMAEFFHACGILILEGYGLTESSAASFVNRPDSFRFGTVGLPAPGMQVKIDPETGEVLMKGRGIMRGYRGLHEVNKETLTDGWLHTGDKGELDEMGRLKITDRIKDLIKTSGGKYVAPQALESRFKALCPYLSQVVVHGNNRNYCVALVTLDPAVVGWARDHGLGDKSIGTKTIAEVAGTLPPQIVTPDSDHGKAIALLAKEPSVKGLVQAALDTLNGELPSYSTIKYFSVLENDFSIDGGELTPSLKVKRKAVETKYKDVIDSFYEGQLKKI